MNNSSKVLIIFFFVLFCLIFSFLNFKIKLEKPDEDWFWENISSLHAKDATIIEKTSVNNLELNIFTSNNYFHLSYQILKIYNIFFENIDNFLNIKKYGFINIHKNEVEFPFPPHHKLDYRNYNDEYFENDFEFGKSKYIFSNAEQKLLNHYNYLYLNNIVFFLVLIFLIGKFKSSYYIYPTLIYFLTPQINSLILYINSDFLTILLTPLICILFKEKKYLYIFLLLFLMQFFNRSNIFLFFIFFHYLYFYSKIISFKLGYKLITYVFIIIALFYVAYLNYDLINKLSFHYKSGLYFIFENNYYQLFYNLFKSILIYVISTLYLNGQNSFLLSYYDYIIFVIFIIIYGLNLLISFKKNSLFLMSLLVFLLCYLFLNGFDQLRHNPIIYSILIFQIFTLEKEENKNFKYLNNSFIIFLIYANLKGIYLQNIIY